MQLFERDELFSVLDRALAAANEGAGRLVAIGGEAGAGKSTLVSAFLASHPEVTIRFGACDPLTTPRPLGPLQDMVFQPSALADALAADSSPANTFPLVLNELRAATA